MISKPIKTEVGRCEEATESDLNKKQYWPKITILYNNNDMILELDI